MDDDRVRRRLHRDLDPGPAPRGGFERAMADLPERGRSGHVRSWAAGVMVATLTLVIVISVGLLAHGLGPFHPNAWAPGGAPSHSPSHWPSTSPTGLPTASPSATAPVPVGPPPSYAPAASRCHTSQLSASFSPGQGAAGTQTFTVLIANTGAQPCTLYGFAGGQLYGAQDQALPTRVVRDGGIYSTQSPPTQFLLAPGQPAMFQVAWSDVPTGTQACPAATRLDITPPDETTTTPVLGSYSVAACGGVLDITPVMPTTRCHTSQLTATFVPGQGAAGTQTFTVSLANHTQSQPCTLYGFVGGQLYGAQGQALPTQVVRNGGIFGTKPAPTQFLLLPGESATFQVAWSDVPSGTQTCPTAVRLDITPPDETTTTPVLGTYSVAPCGGVLDVTPVTPP